MIIYLDHLSCRGQCPILSSICYWLCRSKPSIRVSSLPIHCNVIIYLDHLSYRGQCPSYCHLNVIGYLGQNPHSGVCALHNHSNVIRYLDHTLIQGPVSYILSSQCYRLCGTKPPIVGRGLVHYTIFSLGYVFWTRGQCPILPSQCYKLYGTKPPLRGQSTSQSLQFDKISGPTLNPSFRVDALHNILNRISFLDHVEADVLYCHLNVRGYVHGTKPLLRG